MADFIDKLTKDKQKKLLEEMRIKPNEDVIANTSISSYGNRLYVVHGRNEENELIESVYTDFFIEKIYGSEPSEYDQDRFQNIMISLCGEVYSARVEEFNKNHRSSHIKHYIEGDFGEEEYYED